MVKELVVPSVILLVMLSMAVIQDLRSRRIPNAVVVAGLLAAGLWHAFGPVGAWAFDREAPGATGLLGTSLAGLLALLGWFPLYRWRVLGAGDVKLFAAVAACLGVSSGHVFHLMGVALTVWVTGGALAVVRMVHARIFSKVVANLRQWWRQFRRTSTDPAAPRFSVWCHTADRMPYSVAIALGTTLYLVSTWNGYLTMV